jgi:outer membrane protein OmpA-like peptidoglycan-associated protein
MRFGGLALLAAGIACTARAQIIDVGPYTIFFDRNSAQVGGHALPILNNAAEAIQLLPGGEYLIIGHTDVTGSRESNLRLSCRRARATRAYLISRGLAAERLFALGRGEDAPLRFANARAAEQRRVELQVVGEENRQEVSAGATSC